MKYKCHLKYIVSGSIAILNGPCISEIVRAATLLMYHEIADPILVIEEGKGVIWMVRDGNDCFYRLERKG